MRVLIADDDALSRRMLELVLSEWNYQTVIATDGAEAWAILERDDRPRLAVLDWVMPGLDGVEVTQRLRRDRPHPYVHVLMLTARDSKADLVAGLEAGADDYLPKPFDPQELRVRMNAARRSIDAHDELERLARDLQIKNRRLAELTETAHRFVDNVSHEFRTPLTVIKEYAGIIGDGLAGPVTDTQTDYLQTIDQAVLDLAQMVDDLLDSSKIKAGTLRIDRVPQEAAALIETACGLAAGKARARGIEIRQAIEEGLPPVFADREKAIRVLVNLLVNAIKFSPSGGAVTVHARANGHDGLDLAVTDEGPGLSEVEQQALFRRFSELGHGAAGGAKGFGLGLNIARELAWLNLGSMGVSSVPGRGSTFTCTLPIDRPAVIVERYFRCMGELPPRASRIVALHVEAGAADRDRLRRSITACCYPTDLVLDPGEPGPILMVGLAQSPEAWIGRLTEAQRRAAAAGAAPAEPLELRCLGCWPYPGGSEQAASTILDHCTERLRCA